jgi:hypothetical protein
VDDVVVAAQLRVLREQRVEAVRAGGDHLLPLPRVDGVVRQRLVQDQHVLAGELVVEVLVAGAARRIAGAGLPLAEHRVVDAGAVEQPRHRPGGRLRRRVVGAGAADPEQHLEVGPVVDGGDDDVEAIGPVQPLVRREAPGVAVALQPPEGRLQLGREAPSVMTW